MPISSRDELEKYLTLTDDELAYEGCSLCPPLLISDAIIPLLSLGEIRTQFVPRHGEDSAAALETPDPLGEVPHSATSRLIHRYTNRAAFLTTDRCFAYCRHCFRRRLSDMNLGPATDAEIDAASAYLKAHTEIKEVLLTGGDLFTLSDVALGNLVSSFRSTRPDLILRICTRAPFSNPSRITDSLVSVFRRRGEAPFYLMTQFNCAAELTPEAVSAVSKFVDAGIPALNQTVLLTGVNDSAEALALLSEKLLYARIKPYYVFQGDLVTGTEHLRVPLERTLQIEHDLRNLTSGLGMPVFTLDLPLSGGKVPLTTNYLIGANPDGTYTFRTPDSSSTRRYK